MMILQQDLGALEALPSDHSGEIPRPVRPHRMRDRYASISSGIIGMSTLIAGACFSSIVASGAGVLLLGIAAMISFRLPGHCH